MSELAVTAEFITPPVERQVRITLSEKDAEYLYRLVGNHVLGSEDGPRGATARIYVALEPLGLNPSRLNATGSGTSLHLDKD